MWGHCNMASVCRHFLLVTVLWQVCVTTSCWSLCYCMCVSPLLVGHCVLASVCHHFLLVTVLWQVCVATS
jgi:hypothetical protein